MENFTSGEMQPERGIERLPNGDYRLSTLLFQTENLILKKVGKKIKLRYQEALLLNMFLEARDHFLKRKKVIDLLWPQDAHDRHVCNNRLNMSIKRLREALAADPKIRISCDSKIGYTLYVDFG